MAESFRPAGQARKDQEELLMQLLRTARWLVLALAITLVPVSSHAGVFISVGFAPPVLPVYEQPVCPAPNLMWTPGYWAYSYDTEDYYWVPGAWVPAPYEGALWTPGYWGWSGGLYVFHDGYWGPHVGYYGGVNYGFGYGGIGFAGGEWRGGFFAYNTAVVHVDDRFVHTTFVDRERVDRGFVARDSHVAFSGGPGGMSHPPSPEERIAEHDQHVARTSFQAQHESSAKTDRSSYAKSNGGRPRNLAAAKPLAEERHTPAPAARPVPVTSPTPAAHPVPVTRPVPDARPTPAARPTPTARPAPAAKPAAKPAPKEERETR
jgi:hypothetical protein